MATAAIQGILFLSRSSIWVYTMYIVLLIAVIWYLPEHRPRPWPLQSPHVLAFRLCHPLLHLRLWVGTQDIMDSRPSRIWSKVDDPKHREGVMVGDPLGSWDCPLRQPLLCVRSRRRQRVDLAMYEFSIKNAMLDSARQWVVAKRFERSRLTRVVKTLILWCKVIGGRHRWHRVFQKRYYSFNTRIIEQWWKFLR